jgi:hypothetical protein
MTTAVAAVETEKNPVEGAQEKTIEYGSNLEVRA